METTCTVLLVSHDRVLRALTDAELSPLGVTLVSSEDCVDPIPNGITVLLVDLDSVPLPSTKPAVPVIGITRRERELSPETRAVCVGILHRPFPTSALHALLLPHLASGARQKKYRLLTVRRTQRALPHRPMDKPQLIPSEDGTAIRYGDLTIPLTPGEATVFRALYEADGAPVTRGELLRFLGAESESNLSDVHVCAIRKKLAPHGLEARLHTYRTQGYALLKQ